MLDFIISIDKKVFEYLTLYHNYPPLQSIAEATANMSNYTYVFLIFLGIYFFLDYKKALKFAFFLIILFTLSESIVALVKAGVARPRPGVATGLYFDPKAFSFPSAHSMNTMALAVFLSWWFQIRKYPLILYSVAMGVFRVLSNYHYPLDVIFGWAGGYVLGSIYILILESRVLHESIACRNFVRNNQRKNSLLGKA